MNKKERQRIKKANKLLVSALMLGALCAPAYADDPVTLEGTLDRVKATSTSIVTTIATPIALTSTERPESGEYLTVKIGDTTYYYQGDLPTGFTYKEIQNLVNTGSNALTTTETDKAVFKIGDTSYYYDKTKLPESSYTSTSTTGNHWNFTKMVGNTLTKFNIGFKDKYTSDTNLVKIESATGDADKTFEIKGYKDVSGTITADNNKYTVTINKTNIGTSPNIIWSKEDSGATGSIKINLPNSDNKTTYYYTLTHSGKQVEQNRYDNNNPLKGDIGSAEERHLFKDFITMGETDADRGSAINNTSGLPECDIYADFVSNSSGYVGGAVSNFGDNDHTIAQLGNIIGDFISNSAQYGGAIANEGFLNGNAIIGDIVGDFIANSADKHGGAIYNISSSNVYSEQTGSGSAFIKSIKGNFIDNSAGLHGGGISNSTGYSKKIGIGNINANFIRNTASYGGAISNHFDTDMDAWGKLSIGDITGDFISNSATIHGGAIDNATIKHNTIAIKNIVGDFIGNHAEGDGGVIYNYAHGQQYNSSGNSTITIENIVGDFISNNSGGHGGVIYNTVGFCDTVSINNIVGDFISNSAQYGGVIYSNSEDVGTVRIGNITGNFISNNANIDGGVFYNYSYGFHNSQTNSIIENINGDFIGNHAGQYGGVIYNSSITSSSEFSGPALSEISNINGNFSYNSADKDGGAIANVINYENSKYSKHPIAKIGNIKGDFTGNRAGQYGGAIYNWCYGQGANTLINDIAGNFSYNSADENGGAIYNHASVYNESTIKHITGNFSYNSAKNFDGGAIYNYSSDAGTASISGITGDFIANSANRNGGAIYNYSNGYSLSQINILTGNDKDINFDGNFVMSADGKGGAIYNSSAPKMNLSLTAEENRIINFTGSKDNIPDEYKNIAKDIDGIYNDGTIDVNGAGTVNLNTVSGSGTINIKIKNASAKGDVTQNNLNIANGSTFEAIADNLHIRSGISNKGTLVTYGNFDNLTGLKNNGTFQIKSGKTLDISGNNKIDGTFDLNNSTLNLKNLSDSVYSILTLNTLKGKANIPFIDVTVKEEFENSDKIVFTNSDSATIKIDNINLHEGYFTHTYDVKNDLLTVLSGTGATLDVGDGISTQFGDYLYTFTNGTTNGKLNVTESYNDATLTDYIKGTGKGLKIDTYSFANNETLTDAITTGAAKDTYVIGMNGHNLTGNGTNNGITIANEHILTINGNNGSISGFDTALTNNGTLNLENVIFGNNTTAAISNAGTLNLTGENTFNSKITGTTGTVTNSGTLNIDANNLDVALTNNSILNLGEGTLDKAVTGAGTIVTTGNVSSIASYLGNAVTNTDYTLTLTGDDTTGILSKAITGGNVTIDGTVISNSLIASNIRINGSNSLTINASNVGGKVTNEAGTVNLGTGTLTKSISGNGTTNINGEVTSNASISNSIIINDSNSLTINASNVGNSVSNESGTLNLNNGTLAYEINGNGITNIKGNVNVISNVSVLNKIIIDGANSLTINANNVRNSVSNESGTLNLNEGTLAYEISGNGKTNINGNVISNSAISNAIFIDFTNTLTIDADNVGGNITNTVGIVNLGDGTLNRLISGEGNTYIKGDVINKSIINNNVTISSGTLTSSVDNLTGIITNDKTFNASGTLDKAILGNGTTNIDETLTLRNGASIDGTLNLNNGTVIMSGDDVITTYLIDTLAGNGNAEIDINYGNVVTSDNFDTTNSSGVITISSINEIGTRKDFDIQVIKGGNATLMVTQALKDAFHTLYQDFRDEHLTADVAWNKVFHKQAKAIETSLTASDQNLKLTTVSGDWYDLEDVLGDTLKLINDTDEFKTKNFNFNSSGDVYELSDDLATTQGTLNINGVKNEENLSTIDLNSNTGFSLTSSSVLNLSNTKIIGNAIAIINNGGNLTFNDKNIINGKITGTGTSINNGTLDISANNLDLALTNNSTLNLGEGTLNKAITGTTGTTNINGEVTSNASISNEIVINNNNSLNIAAGNVGGNITNEAGTLNLGTGTLNKLISGAGTTEIVGNVTSTASILNKIIVEDGSLTIGANNIGDEISNAGTVNLREGTLSKSISGNGTTNIKDDVISTATISNAIAVDFSKNLTIDADNVGGNITNEAGTVNLGTGTLTKSISGNGTTNIYGGEVNVAKVIRQNELNIYDGKLTINAGNLIVNTIQNEGVILLGEGTLTSAIAGEGLIAINKNVNVTSNANLLGNYILNAGTLTLTEGILAKGILGGNTVIDGAINSTEAIASAIDIRSGKSLTINANNVLGAVANAGTLNLGAGTLSQSITGTGATVIDGTVTANAITQGALTVNTDKTLTASADNLNISGSLINKGTLATYGNLNNLTTLNNTNGTVKIATGKELNVTNNYELVGGTLDLNGQTLNMQNTGSSVDYSTLTVGTLKGTGNLLIDATLNETAPNSDKIAYTNGVGAEINLTNINLREGFTTHTTDEKDNWITVLVNNGTGPNAELSVGTNGKTSTVFGDYLYTFTKGSEGKLNVTATETTAKIKDYITGTEAGLEIDTYSFANNETITKAIETGSEPGDTRSKYTVGMNGNNLTGNGTNNGITISSEKTLTVDGNGGTITNFATALINKGTLTLNNVKVISNSKTSDNDDVFGGAIKNSGMITTITGATVGENEAAFYNNSATTNADSTEKDVMGGAIYNIGQITKITSDFKENKAIATEKAYAYGGAIYNTQENSVIKEIEGTFTSNEANANDSGARGGAIANFDEAIIGNTDGTGGITGSFNSNKAVSENGSADGGAIFNYKGATITNINANFNQNTSESTANKAYGGAIHNESSGDAIAKITNINGKFSGNNATSASSSASSGAYGGAISNYKGEIGNTDGTGGITGVVDGTGKLVAFDGNYAEAKGAGEANGGAVYNYKDAIITNITGDFINNYTKAQNGKARGGAIHNESSEGAIAKITNINGKFSGNRATSVSSSAYGGAIFNNNGVIGNTDGTGGITGVVDDITGKLVAFDGNYVESNATSGSEADGGAIFNYNGSIITNITGDFINNRTNAQKVKAYGGAIHNSSSKIYNIEGDFKNNTSTSSSHAYAGAISNYQGEIGNFGTTTNTGGIKGNFKSNSATSNGGNAQGGAIFSYITGAKINNIEGNFEDNFVKAKGESSGYAYGGAIYNDTATIGNIENNIGGITGKFSGNYAEAISGDAKGGAIANRNTAIINSITGVNQSATETPDIVAFYNNHAEAKGTSEADGGAIYNEGTIGNITGNFIDNYAVSASGIAQGGAIYNSGAISIVAKNGNEIRFQGNYVKGKDEESSLGGAIYNAAASTIGLYALTKNDKITFAGRTEADKFDIDGIYNLGNLNINGFEKSGETTRYLGEVTLYNVNGTGTTNIYGGIVNAKNSFVQNTLHNEAIFNFNPTDTTKTGVIGALTDATIAKGTTNIKAGSFTVTGNATQDKIIVENDATLSLGGDVTTTSGILNAGTLNLTGGDTSVSPVTFATLNSSIDKYNETVGATNIIGAIKVATGKTIVSNVAVDSTGILELNASLIGADKANITENSGNVILNGGTLASAIVGNFETKADGNAVTIANTYITDKFTNNGTLILDGNIDRNINGSGTTVLKKDTAVSGNYTIAGTLDGNGKTLDMQNSPAAYNTLSVGGFKGTTNLKIDVDMATTESGKATNTDLIKLTGTSQKTEEENAVLNLKSINVTNLADVPEFGEITYNDYVTYLTGDLSNLTLKLNGSETGEITTHAQSGDEGRDYTFTKGSDGSLTVLVKDASLTIEDFITGKTNTSVKTFALNSSYQETDDVIGTTALGTQREGELTLNINNQSTLSGVSKSNDGIIVANGITLNVSGQSNEKQGTMSGFDTALIVDEGEGNVLNVQDMILTDNFRDIKNNATLNLAGTNTIDTIINNGTSNLSGTNTIDTIIGTGTTEIIGGMTTVNNTLTQDNLINNGVLTVGASALNVKNGVTNNDLVRLNGGELTTNINGGNLNIIDETNKVVNNATINVSDIDIFASPTTSAELENNSTIIANNIDNAGVLTANNNSYIKANINGGTFNSNGNNTVVGSIQDNGDSNPATLNLKAGKLDVLGDINVANTVAKGGGLSYINDFNTPASLGALDLQQNMDLYLAADLVQGKMNQIKADSVSVSGTSKINMMLNMPSRIDTVITNPNIQLNPIADGSVETLKGAIKHNSQSVTTPIFNYHTNYDPTTGLMTAATASGGSGSYSDFNPSVFAAPIAAQMGGYLNQLNTYENAFTNMDMYMLLTRDQREAMKLQNKYAAAGTGVNDGMMYDPNQLPETSRGLWFKPYASFEKVNLQGGPKVENNMYGSFFGGDTDLIELKNGWDVMYSAYASYDGSHQNYDGIGIYQNGGHLGATATWYKGNFFTGLTANVGASVAEASTMYGTDNITMLMAGIANKTGYNWELLRGRLIIQPSLLMSYSFVNTFNYRNSAGIAIDSDPLHAIQIAPGLKFIGNLPHGWQPYIGIQMVWNIMDETKFQAANVNLPQLSTKPYIQYGIGVQKRWGDRFTGFGQVMLRNGGRTGIALSAGFRWALGKDVKNPDFNKTSNSVPELPKTKMNLSSASK